MTERSYRNFVGFYWTLPLPALGFKSLPKSADEAATKSRTIRYQRDRVRAYVHESKGTLVAEFVFLEVRSDRGTDAVEMDVERALEACKQHDAQLLYIDFSQGGWRGHPFLMRMMARSDVSCLDLPPEPVLIDGSIFDPVEHFRAVRSTCDGHGSLMERRTALAAGVTDLVAELRANGNPTNQVIADFLNQQGITTITGKTWTSENVKQFLKSIN
jgi:hypothetical protein